jgi:hypothetical protein
MTLQAFEVFHYMVTLEIHWSLCSGFIPFSLLFFRPVFSEESQIELGRGKDGGHSTVKHMLLTERAAVH